MKSGKGQANWYLCFTVLGQRSLQGPYTYSETLRFWRPRLRPCCRSSGSVSLIDDITFLIQNPDYIIILYSIQNLSLFPSLPLFLFDLVFGGGRIQTVAPAARLPTRIVLIQKFEHFCQVVLDGCHGSHQGGRAEAVGHEGEMREVTLYGGVEYWLGTSVS